MSMRPAQTIHVGDVINLTSPSDHNQTPILRTIESVTYRPEHRDLWFTFAPENGRKMGGVARLATQYVRIHTAEETK